MNNVEAKNENEIESELDPQQAAALTATAIIAELAAGLRDVIVETADEEIGRDPEQVYVHLASRLILRLARKLTIVPSSQDAAERIRDADAKGAKRTFDTLTRWMRRHPKGLYNVTFGGGKFVLLVKDDGEVYSAHLGGSVQDACAQAACAMSLNGGAV